MTEVEQLIDRMLTVMETSNATVKTLSESIKLLSEAVADQTEAIKIMDGTVKQLIDRVTALEQKS